MNICWMPLHCFIASLRLDRRRLRQEMQNMLTRQQYQMHRAQGQMQMQMQTAAQSMWSSAWMAYHTSASPDINVTISVRNRSRSRSCRIEQDRGDGRRSQSSVLRPSVRSPQIRERFARDSDSRSQSSSLQPGLTFGEQLQHACLRSQETPCPQALSSRNATGEATRTEETSILVANCNRALIGTSWTAEEDSYVPTECPSSPTSPVLPEEGIAMADAV